MSACADLFTHDQSCTVRVEEVLECGCEAQEQLAVHAWGGFAGLKTMLMDKVVFGAKVN